MFRLAQRALWRLGLDIHRADPDRSPDLFRALLLDHLRIDCVIDVGANVGQFASRLRAVGYRGPIHSFEPVPEALGALRKRARSDADWRVYGVALGRTVGEGTMSIPSSTNLASFLRLAEVPAGLTTRTLTPRAETVSMETLAHIGPSLTGTRIYLKLDTQGYDMEVIEGAGPFLGRVVAIQSEMSILPLYEDAPTIYAALPRLRDLGFMPSTIVPVFRDERLRLREADCILVRA